MASDPVALSVALVEACEHPEMLRQLHAGYIAQPRRSIMLTEIVTPACAAAMRAATDAVVKPLDHPDRGVYDFVDVTPASIESLRRLAAAMAGRDLIVHAARALRFSHRSYQLSGDDHYDLHDAGVFDRLHVELTLDFSAGITGEGELVYQDKELQAVVAMPQVPCAALLLEREPGDRMLYRYMRYLPMSVGQQQVYRLRVVLA